MGSFYASLLGTKSDHRKLFGRGTNLVNKHEADELVKKLGFAKYIECSAMKKDNIKKAFDIFARQLLSGKKI